MITVIQLYHTKLSSCQRGLWLAEIQFSLADIGYAPYILRLDHLQLQFLWDKRPHVAAWYDRVQV